MTYIYQCDNCNTQTDIVKSIYHCSDKEYCEVCKSELKRVYQSPSIKTMDGVKR